jgi:hypothetical protein
MQTSGLNLYRVLTETQWAIKEQFDSFARNSKYMSESIKPLNPIPVKRHSKVLAGL